MARVMERLLPASSVVLVIDIQERLASAMPPDALADVVRSATLLTEGARRLGVPCLVSEQYPRGLGRTLAAVQEGLDAARALRFEKLTFSALDLPEFAAALQATGARDAIVLGMETHVCVYQTARDLVAAGLRVHVPLDGVCSRRADHREVGLSLCERAGAVRTTTESVIFDWLREAGTDAFKELSKRIR